MDGKYRAMEGRGTECQQGMGGLWAMVCSETRQPVARETLRPGDLQQEKVQPQEPRHAQGVHSASAPYVGVPDVVPHLLGSLPPQPHICSQTYLSLSMDLG